VIDHVVSGPTTLVRSFGDRGLKCAWSYKLQEVAGKQPGVMVTLEERAVLDSPFQRGLLALIRPDKELVVKEHLMLLKTGPCGDIDPNAHEKGVKRKVLPESSADAGPSRNEAELRARVTRSSKMGAGSESAAGANRGNDSMDKKES